MDLLIEARRKLNEIIGEMKWREEAVNIVSSRPLTADEAIGSPERRDYPILKGKEVMVEASFLGCRGQAYTDCPGDYSGRLEEIMELPLKNNFERAVFVAASNAFLKYLGKIEKTVHCRNQEPGQCASQLVGYIHERFGTPRIAFIGLQPGMVAALNKHYTIRVIDLDEDNIGKDFDGTIIEGADFTQGAIEWADIILATGSTIVNNSAEMFFVNKPLVFYGVTISGIAYLNGLEHYCFCGH